MDPADSLTLAQLVSLAALMAATCDYAEMMRHRHRRRWADSERTSSEEAGLRGLVRVFLADAPLDGRSSPLRPQ
jgi:hypothetical protein